MTNKTFTLTASQLRTIFDAGVQRGHDEYNYSYGIGSYYDDLIDEVHDIVNAGISRDDDRYVTVATVKGWLV